LRRRRTRPPNADVFAVDLRVDSCLYISYTKLGTATLDDWFNLSTDRRTGRVSSSSRTMPHPPPSVSLARGCGPIGPPVSASYSEFRLHVSSGAVGALRILSLPFIRASATLFLMSERSSSNEDKRAKPFLPAHKWAMCASAHPHEQCCSAVLFAEFVAAVLFQPTERAFVRLVPACSRWRYAGAQLVLLTESLRQARGKPRERGSKLSVAHPTLETAAI